MKRTLKFVCIGLIIPVICFMLSGCFDKREVDDLAYILAIGFDKGKTNYLKMTVQLAVPLAIGGESSDPGTGGGGKSSDIITVETPTIYSGLNMINNFVSKQVNLSHAKVILFSEELSKEGLKKYLHAIIRGREFRPNTYIAIARTSSEEYLKSIKPVLEANPAKYYELLYGNHYTGFIANSQLHDFYFGIESLNHQAVAVLAELNQFNQSKDFNTFKSTFQDKARELPLEGDYFAGDMPRVGGVKGDIMGIAVFVGDKMVGKLDGENTGYHQMVSGNYRYSYSSIPDPIEKDKFVILNLKQSRNPIHKVEMVEGKPNIYVKVILEADFVSIQSGINYEDKTEIFEKSAEDFIKQGILRYLNKTSKEFGSDIAGFGKEMQGKFLFWDEWKNFGWLDRYKDAIFTVDVDFKVRRPGLILRSVDTSEEEGGK